VDASGDPKRSAAPELLGANSPFTKLSQGHSHAMQPAGFRPGCRVTFICKAQMKVTKAKGLKATSDLTGLWWRGALLRGWWIGTRVQPVEALGC
jgi:hypothetical protein